MRGSKGGRRGEQVPGCCVGNTVKRSTMQSTRRPFSRAHFKACFALVLSTFGRGEERRGARVEQPLSSAGSLPAASLVNVPFKLPTRATKLLMCTPHFLRFLLSPNSGFFYFANAPLSPRLLCLFFCFFLL